MSIVHVFSESTFNLTFLDKSRLIKMIIPEGVSAELLPVTMRFDRRRCLCGCHRLDDFLSACIGGLWMHP